MAYNMKGSPFQRNFGIGSPAKHGTLVLASNPPQYPKHRHEGTGAGEKVIHTGGYTTDASKQHTGDKKKKPAPTEE